MTTCTRAARPENRHSGLTVTEVLSVITIVAVLMALLWPIFRMARGRVYDTQCASKLRQYGVALSQYRHDYGGDGVYGDPYAMALTGADKLLDGGYIEHHLLRCPYHLRGQYDYVGFLDQRDEDYREWLRAYFAHWKDDGIVRADVNHNLGPAGDLGSPYFSRKGIGLFLGGHVRFVQKMGNPADFSFWHGQHEYWQFVSGLTQGGQQ